MSRTFAVPTDLAKGLYYDEILGLYAKGFVARDIRTHRLEPRPTKPVESCTLDGLAGNTMLGIHLSQISPGGYKCDHRHLDETCAYMVSGYGYSEFRQAEEGEPIRIEWKAGDVVVIPTNAWHKHTNGDPDNPARQLSFRNATFMNTILHGDEGMYHPQESTYKQGARFLNRFADEPDYFTMREQLSASRIRTNHLRQAADEPLPDSDPSLGKGVARLAFTMGGQRTIDIVLTGIEAGGFVRPHRPMAEEAALVLRGSGRTTIWQENGPRRTIEWASGDLISAPLNTWRLHEASDGEDVRLLTGRMVALEKALGASEAGLDTRIPDRFSELVDLGL